MDNDTLVLMLWTIACVIILIGAIIGKCSRKATIGLTIVATIIMLTVLAVTHMVRYLTTAPPSSNAYSMSLVGIGFAPIIGILCAIGTLVASDVFSQNKRNR